MTFSMTSVRAGSITLTLSFLFFAPGASLAQSAEQLTLADANGDGEISWQEVLDFRTTTFERLDRNNDDFIDQEDTPRLGPAKRRFTAALNSLESTDADGDGRISKAELLEAPAPKFTEADTNDDKVLSKEELADLR